MVPEVIGLICILLLLFFIILGFPISVGLLASGFIGLFAITGWEATAGMVGIVPYAKNAAFAFAAVPLFILMGEFSLQGNIGADAFSASYKWMGRLPGGLAISTSLACGLFGAVSGSSVATAVVFSKVALPEMMKYGYDRRLSTGVIASSGTIACLIPPSGVLIIYGILTQQSIGDLLLAGYIPGLVSMSIYIGQIILRTKNNPSIAPMSSDRFSWKDKIKSLEKLWALLFVALVMILGIYLGIFTPNEGAAFGAFGAFFIALLRKKITVKFLIKTFIETARLTSTIFIIVIGAFILSKVLVVSNLTTLLTDWVKNLPVSPIFVVILFLLVLVFLGMVLNSVAMMAIALPIMFPVIETIGFNAIVFGILVVKSIEIGQITPPVGMNCYVVKAAVGDLVPLSDIFRGILPFFLCDIFTVIIFLLVPQLITWLPSTMGLM